MAIILTRYLYNLEEVKLSYLIALLNKDLDRAYYWMFEMYYSGYGAEAFEMKHNSNFTIQDLPEFTKNCRLARAYATFNTYENCHALISSLCIAIIKMYQGLENSVLLFGVEHRRRASAPNIGAEHRRL